MENGLRIRLRSETNFISNFTFFESIKKVIAKWKLNTHSTHMDWKDKIGFSTIFHFSEVFSIGITRNNDILTISTHSSIDSSPIISSICVVKSWAFVYFVSRLFRFALLSSPSLMRVAWTNSQKIHTHTHRDTWTIRKIRLVKYNVILSHCEHH